MLGNHTRPRTPRQPRVWLLLISVTYLTTPVPGQTFDLHVNRRPMSAPFKNAMGYWIELHNTKEKKDESEMSSTSLDGDHRHRSGSCWL